VRFAEPKESKLVPSSENSMATLEVPLKVRAPKLSDQLLPLCGTPLRSASNTTLTEPDAIIASGFVNSWPSSSRTLNASKSRMPGASRFDVSEPPVAAEGTYCSFPLPIGTELEPKSPLMYMVPKAPDSKPAPKVGSRSE
jgi:hypothetical protein